METSCRVVLRYVLLVDGTIHLLDHLEVLMDGVAREGVERHGWAGHLERTRRQVVDVRDAYIWTQREPQTRSPSAEQELIRWWQAGVATRDGQNTNIG